jgi:DNA polymerase III subunit epsilon
MMTNSWLENQTWIVFDTETSGAYPVGSEVVEIGAIKYQGHQIVDQLQLLIRPEKPVPEDIIAIHHITNEMLDSCPRGKDLAEEIFRFFQCDFCVAHHAPFDLAFMAHFFETYEKPLPKGFGLCTSLLGRKLIHEVENHRLQTLARHFGFPSGQAHRALDDAKTCAQLFFKILSLLPTSPNSTNSPNPLNSLKRLQSYSLSWDIFSIKNHSFPWMAILTSAIQNQKDLDVVYNKGSYKGMKRRIRPLGLVLSPLDGDYTPAWCYLENKKKRFSLNQFSLIALSL